MASQAAIFAETIAGMKKAIKRKAYDSDSEESIDHLTNRGNKLRKKARFVHEGQLAPPSGPEVYKRKIEHAGYQREIISRNPPLIDEDGYEVDSDDDDERAQAAMTAAAEFDPYSDVRIEHLLAPLSAAADLPNHPTLSIPFTSKTLTELTRQAGEMVQKEKASLWRIKHLLTRLSGDSTWIPCETVETDNDFALFIDEREPAQPNILEKAIARANGDQVSTGTMVSEDTEHVDRPLLIEGRPEDATMGDASHTVKHLATDGGTLMGSPSHMSDTEKAPVATSGTSKGEETTEQLQHNGLEATLNDSMEVDGTLQTSADEPILDQVEQAAEVELIDGEGDDAEVPAPRRMRTRAQAQAASDINTSRSRSASSDSESETFIHPYFLTPASSRHDRNIGLPQLEADETRRLLQLYIQKQEEVCRGAQKVHEGLLKADRYRKLVMKWAKAEAHVGLNRDLSDGEDWYDKEEWGLDEDLKKGQDEEEEDAATTAKKTRTRRQ